LLKNLVLPCIQSFTIIDGKVIDADDIENNFFIPAQSIGKSRGQVATRLLLELNEDVKGTAIHTPLMQILHDQPSFLQKFQLVIVTDVCFEDPLVLKVSQLCNQYCIPLVYARSVGFIGHIRLQLPEHFIIESHPENAVDLRLDQPWPELVSHCQNTSFEGDSMVVSHIPYSVILIKVMQQWFQEVIVLCIVLFYTCSMVNVHPLQQSGPSSNN
jgi:NEDD8-activating enzyme E1 regulatory subunit